MITLDFLLTSLVVVLIPGTGVLFTVAAGLTQGKRASVFAAVGCTAGIVPHLLAAIVGLAALLHMSALAFQALKLSQMLALSGIFMAMTFVVFVAYGVLADAFRHAVIESARVQNWLRRGFAAAFAGLGIDLALAGR